MASVVLAIALSVIISPVLVVLALIARWRNPGAARAAAANPRQSGYIDSSHAGTISISSSMADTTAVSGGRRHVAFLHLDLGLGGAERLVVDAALALQAAGHTVSIFTTAHRSDHCFPETLPADELLIPTSTDSALGRAAESELQPAEHVRVVVRATWVPHLILGKMQSVCGMARMVMLSLVSGIECCVRGAVFGEPLWDVVVVDGVSACIPILRLFGWLLGFRVLFYCHFPDQLLVRKRGGIIRKLYRAPLDALEAWTTAMAHRIVVNSQFTRQIFRATFPSIRTEPAVVYPAVAIGAFDKLVEEVQQKLLLQQTEGLFDLPDSVRLILSINRFDPLKKLDVAITAFNSVRETLGTAPPFERVQLVVAGGYDYRVAENRKCLEQLQALCNSRQLQHCTLTTLDRQTKDSKVQWPREKDVIFIADLSATEKAQLLTAAEMLIYTPTGEHFGIVPCEAMLARTPVIAAESGGLLETVRDDEKVGLLCEPGNAQSFSCAMIRLLREPSASKMMGENGRLRVEAEFSRTRLQRDLDAIVCELAPKIRQKQA